MSDEDKDSKSEDPTEKKVNDTLDKGNVPFSREVTNLLSIFAITVTAYFYAPKLSYEIAMVAKGVFANLDDWPLNTPEGAMNVGSHVLFSVGALTLIFVLPIMFLGVIASIVQNRPRIVMDRIQPKIERLSLNKGINRLFGSQGLREFFKSLFKFSAAGVTTAVILFFQMDWVMSHLLIEAIRMPLSIHVLVVQAGIGVTVMMSVLAAIDFVWVRREWFANIRMSHKEIKDERKLAEGDPLIKVRSQSLARDRARSRMLANVTEATVVVANPTHFSVAMRYNREIDHAPVVMAKGQDLIALKIREIAEENAIPIVEDKLLARSLYKVSEIDHEIPVEFYAPIAQIVRSLTNKG